MNKAYADTFGHLLVAPGDLVAVDVALGVTRFVWCDARLSAVNGTMQSPETALVVAVAENPGHGPRALLAWRGGLGWMLTTYLRHA